MDVARARRLLGVEADASDEAVEAAFRERVKEEHPDQSDRADSTERFKQLQAARETLLNAETGGRSSGTTNQSPGETGRQSGGRDAGRQSGGRDAGRQSGSRDAGQNSSRRRYTDSTSADGTSTRTEYTDTGGPDGTASRREYAETGGSTGDGTGGYTRGTTDPGSWDNTEYDVGGTETADTDDSVSLHDLRTMAPREFARAVADHWASMGYDTAVRHASSERGIDVVAADPQSGERVVIQGTQAPAGTTYGGSEVRQYGSLQSHPPYPDRVVAVTTGSFSGRAVAVAADVGVDLVDGQQLVSRLDRSEATGAGGSILHRGVHEPAGSLTLGDSAILAGSILSIGAFASVAYLYGEFGVPVVISRTVRLAVVAGWLLTLGLLSGLLQRDDMDRPPHLEGKYLLASACVALVGGATVASDSGFFGDVLVLFGVFAIPLVGLASVVRSYLADG
jgi:hypothetical protein